MSDKGKNRLMRSANAWGDATKKSAVPANSSRWALIQRRVSAPVGNRTGRS